MKASLLYPYQRSKVYINDFFTKGHQRSIKAKTNIAISLIIKGISILISLALVPLTINYINPTQYGIWLTLSSIISWFSFFDIGFSHGLRNKFAEAKATGNVEKARIYISTTYTVLGIVFTLVWILFFIANYFLNWSKILNAPNDINAQLSRLAIIVFSFFCLQIVLKNINTVLIADQKPAKSAFFDMLGQILSLGVIYILTKKSSGSIVNLGLAMSVAPIFILVVSTFWFYLKQYRDFAPSFKLVRFSYAKEIMNLGIKFFIIQVGAILIFQTTNMIITQVLGPQQVTVYNIAYKYFFILSMMFIIVISPFWSAFTEAYIKRDFVWMNATIVKLKKIWLFSIPFVIFMVMMSNIAYEFWVGKQIQIPLSVSISMAIYVLLFTRFNLFIYLINGIGKIQLQLYLNLAICIIYIPLAIILCKLWGIAGIILANILVSLTHAIISQIQIKKLMNCTASGIWNK